MNQWVMLNLIKPYIIIHRATHKRPKYSVEQKIAEQAMLRAYVRQREYITSIFDENRQKRRTLGEHKYQDKEGKVAYFGSVKRRLRLVSPRGNKHKFKENLAYQIRPYPITIKKRNLYSIVLFSHS